MEAYETRSAQHFSVKVRSNPPVAHVRVCIHTYISG